MIIIDNQEKMRKIAADWIKEDTNIIELGCSDGNFASILNELGNHHYIGIDIQREKIDSAKKSFPKMNFMCCDICENLYMLGGAKTFVSFQCLEHIENDLKILKSLKVWTKVIISVPNSPYKGHVRWFEMEGWIKRFSPFIDFDEKITIQHPKKKNKRSFLLKGVRNARV